MTSCGQGREALGGARRVVVKVGSAVLTNARGVSLEMVEYLAGQLAALHDRGIQIILVSSGAVASGRAVLRQAAGGGISEADLAGLGAKQAASAVGQSRLMHYYDLAFAARGKVSAQVLLTREDLLSRGRFLNARNTFATLLEWGVIPVVNENDTVAVQELKFGDNDNLASLLLNACEADLFINLTSASGVLADSPQVNPRAGVMECIEDIESLDLNKLCGGKTSVGTGGMYSKLLAVKRAAQLGVPSLILPGREPGVLLRAFAGEKLGTWVRAGERSVSRRKFWMAYNAPSSGALQVDAGAAKALVSGGKSLLPAGIIGVEGSFGSGALVNITDEQGNKLGVGLSNYPAAVLRRIMGRKLKDVAEILGGNHHPEAVHRDNMLMQAVG